MFLRCTDDGWGVGDCEAIRVMVYNILCDCRVIYSSNGSYCWSRS